MLIVVLLAGRIPVVERTLGQDRLTRWHRKLAPWSLVLIAAHGVLITAGYAAERPDRCCCTSSASCSPPTPASSPRRSAFVLLMAAGVTSARIARRRMRYETWWAVHLYTYLALALSFSHQLATGASFVGHPVARMFWTALWIGTAGIVVAYRILLPAVALGVPQPAGRRGPARRRPASCRSCSGAGALHRLPLSGGQFFQWRFLKRGMWWQAHPYSVSALPDPPYLRFTVKDARRPQRRAGRAAARHPRRDRGALRRVHRRRPRRPTTSR